jgi:hypothetical protein
MSLLLSVLQESPDLNANTKYIMHLNKEMPASHPPASGFITVIILRKEMALPFDILDSRGIL